MGKKIYRTSRPRPSRLLVRQRISIQAPLKTRESGELPNPTQKRDLEEDKEIRYFPFLDEVEDGYLESDLDLRTTVITKPTYKLFGYEHDEYRRLQHAELIPEDSLKAIHEAFDRVQASGDPARVFHEIQRGDGKRIFLETNVHLKRNSEGNPIGFRSIVRDITDRKRAEEALASERRHLEAIFRSVKDAIITVDPNLKVISANEATKTICGASFEDMRGRIIFDCMKDCERSCSKVFRKTAQDETATLKYRVECKHVKRPQQTVEITASPLLEPDGQSVGAVLVIRDMTRISDLERELSERHQFHKIIGKSRKMQEIYSLLEQLCDLETTVLVMGESGTGKELVARALHFNGVRKDKPFVSVNCSALAETLLESELFGHVKGAFTGAVKDKIGRFQAAHGGTMLLDEIGDVSPRIQLKLLRVLQEKEFERVGESTPHKVDVRVIACTNQDLKEKVRKGEFREDLYYRLKVMEITLPPLRERKDDILLLVRHFLEKFNVKFLKTIEGLSDDVIRCFMDYPWPGNVRELEHAMERAYVLCPDRTIRLEHIPLDIKGYAETRPVSRIFSRRTMGIGRQEIVDVLDKTDWNKAKASRILGIGRRTLYNKLAEYNINPPAP